MITSLARNGLTEGFTSVKPHRTSAVLIRRVQNRALSVSHVSHRPIWQPSGRVSVAVRLHSTATPPRATKPTDVPSPISSTALPSRKHKVELRPGPVKTLKSSQTPAEGSNATSPKPVKPEQLASTSSTPAPSNILSESVVEATKHDYEAASRHGILAPPPEGANRVYKLYHQAKELIKFYFRGIKLINTHRLRVREMQQRVQAGGQPLTRWETRFIETYKLDALKLIPFAIVIIVLEEIIPLIVLYAPFMLPSTCILPSQKERIDLKKREQQKMYAITMKDMFERVHKRGMSDGSISVKTLLEPDALLPMSGILALPTWGPTSIRLRRIQQHLKSIIADDVLLKREGMGQKLSQEELKEALAERGLIVDTLNPKQMKSRLQWWLSQANGDDFEDSLRQRVLLIASSGAGRV